MNIEQVQKPVFQLNRAQLKEILATLYGLDDAQVHEWVSGLCTFKRKTLWFIDDVSKSEFGDYAEWLKEEAPPNENFVEGLWNVLGDAANHDLIPEGAYVVELDF